MLIDFFQFVYHKKIIELRAEKNLQFIKSNPSGF
jgi:hypothetical protein